MATTVITITEVTRIVLREEHVGDRMVEHYSTAPGVVVTKQTTTESVADVNEWLARSAEEKDRACEFVAEFDQMILACRGELRHNDPRS